MAADAEPSSMPIRVSIGPVAPRSVACADLRSLRHRVLREPLGLSFSDQDIAAEAGDIHLAAWRGDTLVGGVLLRPATAGTAKLRQMAVLPEFQGRGIGRQLVRAAEERARSAGFSEMRLHARETAVGFYEACGFLVEGEVFVEVTIPHRVMHKRL